MFNICGFFAQGVTTFCFIKEESDEHVVSILAFGCGVGFGIGAIVFDCISIVGECDGKLLDLSWVLHR